MDKIDNRIIRTTALPMPEEAQRKFEKLERVFGKKNVEKDSLMQNFATGMLAGLLGIPFPAFICASQIRLLPKSTDWKVRALASLFFATTCALVARCLGFKDLLQFSPLNPVIISNAFIRK